MEFLNFFNKVNLLTPDTIKQDDDPVARLSHKYTSTIVMVFLVFIAAKQYVGQPIECWVPKHFSGDWQTYTENYCWVKNTYFVPHEDELPGSEELHKRSDAEIGYYQWIPFILAGLIVWLNLPWALWKILYAHAGIPVESIISMAHNLVNINSSERTRAMNTLSSYVEEAILNIESKDSFFARFKRVWCWCFSRQVFGTYLSSLYIFVKLFYFVNVILQFVVLNNFLTTNNRFFGTQMLKDISAGRDWTESGHFPRVTMCDFSIRTLGQRTHNYTVQCVLMINLFNEKVFIFLWAWYIIVAVASFFSFFNWLSHCTMSSRRFYFIKKYLKLSREYRSGYDDAIVDFLDTRLKVDGVLLIHLISENSGDVACTELLKHMWKRYKQKSKYFDDDDRD